jgi:hypothetical protein
MSKKSKARKAAKRGTIFCAYCGASSKDVEVTDDHVIPRALYPEPKPPDSSMLIVPACEPCNLQMARDESYLRDWLTMSFETSTHPQASAVFHTAGIRSVRTNRSELARTALFQAAWKPVYTKAGLYLGHGFAVPIEGERLNTYFQMVTRGLYYAETKERLADDCIFEVVHIQTMGVPETWRHFVELSAQTIQIGTPGVCIIARLVASEVPQTRLYFVVFYETIGVMITTYPREYQDRVNAVDAKTAELLTQQEVTYGAG